ncbi:hypothetical protein AB0G02_24800 [Actinosynnema sp. NPDC023658]|uniref:hypothetical protein n=1 Tax=Actinosynnema sp. NPDC023658 TaxID=3155465 RepID=UPI003405F6E9
MPSTSLLFAGDPAEEGYGLRAAVSSEPPPQVWRRSNSDALLVPPLLRLIGDRGDRRIVVGAARVEVTAEGETSVTFQVRAVWREDTGWRQESDREGLDEVLVGSLAEPAHRFAGDPASVAVMAGKALAEASRNEVAGLRGLRYDLERHVADLLAQRRSTALRSLLAQVIELSMAFSRARDHARETIRETRPETATHLAALRHCEAMDVELAEEVARLQALLTSMSTFAVAQDGEAQQRFNMVAAAAAAGLGLPALILSLYGADAFLPFSFDHAWRALLPIALTALVAVGVVLRRMPGRATWRHYAAAVGLVALLVCVLLVAGLLAPTNPGAG